MQNQKQMMKQLQQMNERIAKLQDELNATVVTGSAGGGAVTITANGAQEVTAVVIEPEALEEGAELLADMVLAAVNQALSAARELQTQQMGQLTAGLGLPPGLL